MQLDTTILQTRTVEELVEFVREIIGVDGDSLTVEQLNNFNEISAKFNKAQQRRTSRYGKEKAFVDLDE